MKYTIKDSSGGDSSENICSLEVHFSINVILVDRYEKDVMISLDEDEIELIKTWFTEQTQHVRDVHGIKIFTIEHTPSMHYMQFSMSFSFSSDKPITFSFLKSLLEEFAEPDIQRVNFLEIRGMIVFPFAYIDGSI
jgi:hypothetical protein